MTYTLLKHFIEKIEIQIKCTETHLKLRTITYKTLNYNRVGAPRVGHVPGVGHLFVYKEKI